MEDRVLESTSYSVDFDIIPFSTNLFQGTQALNTINTIPPHWINFTLIRYELNNCDLENPFQGEVY